MTYVWLPLAIVAVIFVLKCMMIVLTESGSASYSYYTSGWVKFVGWVGIIATLVYVVVSVAGLGHAIATGR